MSIFLTKSNKDKIRAKAALDHKDFNGEYLSEICANCGEVWMDDTGITREANILLYCSKCYSRASLFRRILAWITNNKTIYSG